MRLVEIGVFIIALALAGSAQQTSGNSAPVQAKRLAPGKGKAKPPDQSGAYLDRYDYGAQVVALQDTTGSGKASFGKSGDQKASARVASKRPETGEPRDPAGTATVTVMQDGTPAWDKDPVTLDELIVRLKTFHLQHPEADAHILINGDAEAPFSQVIYVFNEARKAGIQKVLIETHSVVPGKANA